ncbi:MAG: hypothetical protein AAGM84_14225 [Pseudomonadota bacterium]
MAEGMFACALFCAAVWAGLFVAKKKVLNGIWRDTWGIGAGLFAALALLFSGIGW